MRLEVSDVPVRGRIPSLKDVDSGDETLRKTSASTLDRRRSWSRPFLPTRGASGRSWANLVDNAIKTRRQAARCRDSETARDGSVRALRRLR